MVQFGDNYLYTKIIVGKVNTSRRYKTFN